VANTTRHSTKPRRIYIVAGNFHEFEGVQRKKLQEFRSNENLQTYTEFKYVSSADVLRGL